MKQTTTSNFSQCYICQGTLTQIRENGCFIKLYCAICEGTQVGEELYQQTKVTRRRLIFPMGRVMPLDRVSISGDIDCIVMEY